MLVLCGAATVLGLISCEKEPTPDPECECINKDHVCTCNLNSCECFLRTHTITIADKDITIKDTRTGKNDQPLNHADLDVISRLEAGLVAGASERLTVVIGRGLTIEVKENPGYDRFNVYTGNKIGANLDYILSDNEWFADWLANAINEAYDLPDPNVTAKAKNQGNIFIAKAPVLQYNRAMQLRDNRIA